MNSFFILIAILKVFFGDLIGQLLLIYCTPKQFMVLYILLYRLISLL